MDVERLLRDVEKRLSGQDAGVRREVLDAIQEAFGRERRRHDPAGRAETERERRQEAETLREVLESINRHPGLEDTAHEVLKQILRLVTVDSALLALLEGDGWRVIAVRGYPEAAAIVGQHLNVPLFDEVVGAGFSLAIPDVAADPRGRTLPAALETPSWAGFPLLVEGETVGLLAVGRDRIQAFEEEELHRVRALAFSAAAAVRRARSHEQVRLFAVLMERVASLAELALKDPAPGPLAAAILDGALAIGNYRGGLLVLDGTSAPAVTAARGGGLEVLVGRPAPGLLNTSEPKRLPRADCGALAELLGGPLPSRFLYLVPLASQSARLGTLALLDPDGETPDDRVMDAYAVRAASIYEGAAKRR